MPAGSAAGGQRNCEYWPDKKLKAKGGTSDISGRALEKKDKPLQLKF